MIYEIKTQLFKSKNKFLLIGVELLETIKAYLSENVVHSEIVLEVALIAIARKVITLNVKEYEPMTLIGLAALIFAISVSFFFIRRCRIDLRPIGSLQRDYKNKCTENIADFQFYKPL